LICGVAAVRLQNAIENRHNGAPLSVSEEGHVHTVHERVASSDHSVAQSDKNGDEVTSPASPLAPPNAQVLVESAAASPGDMGAVSASKETKASSVASAQIVAPGTGELSAQNSTAGAPTAPARNRTRQVEEDYE
jgi:hypothetical protein